MHIFALVFLAAASASLTSANGKEEDEGNSDSPEPAANSTTAFLVGKFLAEQVAAWALRSATEKAVEHWFNDTVTPTSTCATYPTAAIDFCSGQAHHHRVASDLADEKMANLRDREADLIWQDYIGTNSGLGILFWTPYKMP